MGRRFTGLKRPRFKRGLSLRKKVEIAAIGAILLFCHLDDGIGQEVIVIHPNVGATIDLDEKIHYGIFPEFYNFSNAQFYQITPDSIIAKIQLWNNDGTTEKLQYYTPYQIYILASGIAIREPLDDKVRESIHKRFQPLYTDMYLADIPENTYCRLKLNNKRAQDAVYYRMKGDSVLFWIKRKVVPINKDDLLKLKYWDNYEQKNWIKWCCVGSAALAAYYGTGWLADWINLSSKNKILTQYSAASVGCVLGYYISPLVNDRILAATVIEFRTSRIKRLDTLQRTYYNLKKIKDKIWQTIVP